MSAIQSQSLSDTSSCFVSTRNLLYSSAMDSIAYSGVFVAAAVAAQFFIPLLTAPLAITALSVYVANVALNFFKDRQTPCIKEYYEKSFEVVDSIQKKWPYLANILLISAVIISVFSLAISSLVIISYSILTAVKICVKKNMENNNVLLPDTKKSYVYIV